ncbi:MAG: 2,3,4,5-tetrahydropyridine-2,6-dicarboxylate N-acetyltransferase [Erysipelotrichaceae bacterium]|nr:2,3,4,5-tetrahydropyridine-2,6-dicarboxylate N-acetyltransferase [Erysipelotrichaceae bacterium]
MKNAEEIIDYIKKAEKKTPVKCYIRGKDLPDINEFQTFDMGSTKLLIGDLDVVKGYIETYKDDIEDYYIDYDRRNSAIPLLDTTNINARIEPGSYIREGAVIGDHAVIMMGAVINIGAVVGEGTMVDMNAVLGGRAIVGKHCHIGAGTVLAGVIEPASNVPVIIDDDVMIGANAVVLEGVHVGQGAVIGAGTIVMEDVPPYSVVVGNPGRVVKQKDEATIAKTKLVDDLRQL